ncbi:D-alanyl-D-alanine carboxypeptidase (penicillin-binding protein 5/6) [Amycolatopsis cihanbeyliensis]|uniref:D-alanyl-D-alanine carboxypeptidase (Penicillin-binding protein 5/6) n=1 Tax=Amycolatopsis cihanbeyliensis TaxID=1128664 RepID=A0A542DIW6_AMYCI|nr:D-alanyl-D-alanine carboxypeptidase (penicillin-binding protein 5/6) [Amycolatopsis cihanbeyliensis]
MAVLSGLLTMSTPLASAQTGTAAPDGDCPNRLLPPPPVDTSERPPPGQESPEPPPVPDRPAGGERMGECGPVLPPDILNPPAGTTAQSWLLHDLDSGDVLVAKNPHGRYRPASLIKVLLALVAIEEMDGDDRITPTTTDAEQECTCVGIKAGSSYAVDDLLHGLLMRSGNDVAHAFATALGGVPAALEKMNALAEQLGARDTHAATPSGLDGPGMMSSAYDLSLIFNYAMRQPEFAEAVATREIEFPGGRGEPAFPIYNDNRLLRDYPGFLGGKTGFTDDARHTYVGAAEREGRRLAVVMLRSEQRPTRVSAQAAELLDYGFRVAATGVAPVGRIFYTEPTSEAAAPTAGDEEAELAGSTTPEDPFGVTGWVITLVAAVLSIGGVILVHRRRQAEGS